LSETSPDPAPARTPGRGRVIAARILVVLGVLLTLISLLSNFVKREALDSGNFRETSEELIANDTIRDQVALTMVDALYQNVDVATELQDQLPANLKRLAGPIAGVSRELTERAARELLERPRVQQLFVTASSAAHAQLIAVLEDETEIVETTGGNVVLDIRPLVLELGDRFNFVDNLAARIPEDAATVTILESENLETAQNLTQALKAVANWIWVLAIAAWAVALWLVPGGRRREVRAIGVGLFIVGVLVLAIRAFAGSYIVENVVVTESVKPAASEAWEIITDSLAASGWVAIWVGILVAAGAWVTGPGKRALACRRWLAPHLRRPEIAYGGFALLLVVGLWLLPVQEVRTELLLIVLSIVGFEVLRHQVAREVPAPVEGDVLGDVRERVSSLWESRGKPSRTEELERLAKLHADGALSDEEFAAAKADLFS
jgi:hypothetical protein